MLVLPLLLSHIKHIHIYTIVHFRYGTLERGIALIRYHRTAPWRVSNFMIVVWPWAPETLSKCSTSTPATADSETISLFLSLSPPLPLFFYCSFLFPFHPLLAACSRWLIPLNNCLNNILLFVICRCCAYATFPILRTFKNPRQDDQKVVCCTSSFRRPITWMLRMLSNHGFFFYCLYVCMYVSSTSLCTQVVRRDKTYAPVSHSTHGASHTHSLIYSWNIVVVEVSWYHYTSLTNKFFYTVPWIVHRLGHCCGLSWSFFCPCAESWHMKCANLQTWWMRPARLGWSQC